MNNEENTMTNVPNENGPSCNSSSLRRETSMSSLIIWNISKVVERNPNIDLWSAMKTVQELLESGVHDVDAITSQHAEERYLACALLAWQQLGHKSPDSLYRFVESRRNNEITSFSSKSHDSSCSTKTTEDLPKTNSSICDLYDERPKADNLDGYRIAPVMKLPMETKIVMRLDAKTGSKPQDGSKRPKTREKDILEKINQACCLESECVERLTALDTATAELRTRATKLARREAERVQLLERAEAAWRDLELGYQRRLTLAQEKEDDMMRQTQKQIEERNGYKNACVTLAKQLKERGETAEKERARLQTIETDVCARACTRLHLMEQSAREDAVLADQQCKAAQLDRDLQSKEEQARRKVLSLESEVESTRALSYEAERAMRAELSALRDQLTEVSKKLLAEDANNTRVKAQLEELRGEKMEIVEDLGGCKVMCDKRMQSKADELKKKQEQLSQLVDKVLECRCKLPKDAAVEVRRTPSLAALCQCTPEDKLLESCSCTSIRSRLLSTMLADLFEGLQSELASVESEMPCQLLKCLEDRHNWDRASITKTNLRNFFCKLLMGELDIAIATSIEKYHAKWVGASCADVIKMDPEPDESQSQGWQQRAIERKAQKLAEQLAEKMFQDKAEELAKRTKTIVASSGPPPCECKQEKSAEATFRCQVERSPAWGPNATSAASPGQWRRTSRDVTLLRTEIQNLKRESIKKKDFKVMEKEIAKIVQLATSPSDEIISIDKDINTEESSKKVNNLQRVAYTDAVFKHNVNNNKVKKTIFDVKNYSKNVNRAPLIQRGKAYKKQSYAVNLCLCSVEDTKKLKQHEKNMQNSGPSEDYQRCIKQNSPTDLIYQISSVKHPKSSVQQSHDNNVTAENCNNDHECFHKVPSNKSINELLKTLIKWNCDLSNLPKNKKGEILRPASLQNTIINTSVEGTDDADKIKIKVNAFKEKNKLDKPNSNENVKALKSYNDTVVLYNVNSRINENNRKVAEIDRSLLTTANSEYMGAINLDKSNENFCKCVLEVEIDNNVPMKCIESCNCPLKSLDFVDKLDDVHRKLKNGTKLQQASGSFHNQQHKQAVSKLKEKTKKTDSKTTSFSKNLNKINPLKSNTDGDTMNNISKEQNTGTADLSILVDDKDYQIELLGVTLTNANFDKIKNDTKRYSRICNQKNSLPLDDNDMVDKKNETRGVFPRSQCNLIKNTIVNAFNNQHEDYTVNEDKTVDTQSFIDGNSVEQEPCTCCCDSSKNNLSKEESYFNLEVNTFLLLQQHLKEKLKDIKLCCTSSCIQNYEEEKIYSSLFQKIKEVIADSTGKVACKCLNECPAESSWNRAFNLLQEYIKTKMKRVQCMCNSPNENTTILPEVMNKVFALIENDFQRLKEKCKCGDIQLTSPQIKSGEQLVFQVPEKDTNLSSNFIMKQPNSESTDLCKLISNKSIIVKETVSSQVPPNLGMETKSCSAIEKGTANMQSKSCDCRDTFKSIGINDPFLELLGTNEDMDNKNILSSVVNSSPSPYNPKYIANLEKIEEKKAKQTGYVCSGVPSKNLVTLPYIGYTVDCSCDHNLGCVCTKSIIEENNLKIDNIWKTFTKTKPCKNVSYILDNVNKKTETLNIGPNITDANSRSRLKSKYMKRHVHNLCDIKTSADDGLEIMLKDSAVKTNIIPQHTTTNTYDEDLANSEADINEWYECGAQHTENIKFMSVHSPVDNMKRIKSEVFVTNQTMRLPRSFSGDCDCNVVPICHVKMLMENIENKLVHSECTCDSLSSTVCPVHSIRTV